MNNEDDRVALQAIEFWSTVCDEEMDLKEELLEVSNDFCEYIYVCANILEYRLIWLVNNLNAQAIISPSWH
jgi:hypothetical protein